MKHVRYPIVIAVLACSALANCSPGKDVASTYTLYRNSPFGHAERVHWATFDGKDSSVDINRNQCGMASRLLNANIRASAKADGKDPYPDVGFWCEPGAFAETGRVPTSFEAEYPTDVKSGPHF